MISELKVKKYRKLVDINFDFTNDINLISGANGTCKSSLLYLISNSFSKCTSSNKSITDNKCLKILRTMFNNLNLKIESLTKDSKGTVETDHKGIIYTAKYEDGKTLEFRKHNSKTSNGKNRFAIKPKYSKGKRDSIPQIPVIYLGLSRLYSYGEYLNDDLIKTIKNRLPRDYIEKIQINFKLFTQTNITISEYEKMGDIKNRASFSSNIQGYDSNTISAGEDNLLIILIALESLHYYFDSICNKERTASLFLIDEMDATLHPDYQIKMLDLFKKYAELYNIKFIFTSHSLTTIEYSIEKKYNVIYLLDYDNRVDILKDPNIFTIKSLLHNRLRDDIFAESAIPVFTEDQESRDFLNAIFDSYLEMNQNFSSAKSYLYLPNLSISSQQLMQMFSDPKLNKNFIHSICILDGDMRNHKNLNNCIITLPSNDPPEVFLFNYMEELYSSNDDFIMNKQLIDAGFSKKFYIEHIKNKIDTFEIQLQQKKDSGESTNGDKREFYKKIYNENRKYLLLFFKQWAKQNREQINNFMADFYILFLKTSVANNVPSNLWHI